MKKEPAKRVDIISVKLVKESSILYKDRKISSPDQVVKIVKDFVANSDREKFIAIHLNTKGEPASLETVSIGSLNSSIVHPREVFKSAILSNASGVIFVHNHPSGDPTPSIEDIKVTERLKEAGDLLGINVIDHVIVGETDRYYSFKEEGKL